MSTPIPEHVHAYKHTRSLAQPFRPHSHPDSSQPYGSIARHLAGLAACTTGKRSSPSIPLPARIQHQPSETRAAGRWLTRLWLVLTNEHGRLSSLVVRYAMLYVSARRGADICAGRASKLRCVCMSRTSRLSRVHGIGIGVLVFARLPVGAGISCSACWSGFGKAEARACFPSPRTPSTDACGRTDSTSTPQ